jgi:DNA invertase Pin-like site-specific DNA recombinase
VKRAQAKGTKSGRAFGRPKIGRNKEIAIRTLLAEGNGVLKTAKLLGCGVSVVQRVKSEDTATMLNTWNHHPDRSAESGIESAFDSSTCSLST